MAVIRLIVLRAAELSFKVFNAEHFSHICTRQVRWMFEWQQHMYTAISASTANHHVFYFRLGNNSLACLLASIKITPMRKKNVADFSFPEWCNRIKNKESHFSVYIDLKGSNRVNQISLELSKKMNDTRLIWFRISHGDICGGKKIEMNERFIRNDKSKGILKR